MVSYTLVTVYMIAAAGYTNCTRGANALVKEGLSVQNIALAVVGLTAFAWPIRWVANRAVRASTLVVGTNCWIALT